MERSRLQIGRAGLSADLRAGPGRLADGGRPCGRLHGLRRAEGAGSAADCRRGHPAAKHAEGQRPHGHHSGRLPQNHARPPGAGHHHRLPLRGLHRRLRRVRHPRRPDRPATGRAGLPCRGRLCGGADFQQHAGALRRRRHPHPDHHLQPVRPAGRLRRGGERIPPGGHRQGLPVPGGRRADGAPPAGGRTGAGLRPQGAAAEEHCGDDSLLPAGGPVLPRPLLSAGGVSGAGVRLHLRLHHRHGVHRPGRTAGLPDSPLRLAVQGADGSRLRQ